MRTFLIGSKKLSVHLLHTLISSGHEVVGVYSRDSDKNMGIWHEQLGHPSLYLEAEKLGIPVYEGMKVNSDQSLSLLNSLNLDLIITCFWSEIFKEPILNIAKLGAYNFHTAALPRNRGSRPIPWAIINGDQKAGITCHRMMTGVDNGPIIDQECISIDNSDTAASLYKKLTEAGVTLAKRIFPTFVDGSFKLELQNDDEATYQLRGEPHGSQVNHFWDGDLKTRFQRAFTFPPFRGYRKPPQESRSAEVVVIPFEPRELSSVNADKGLLRLLEIPEANNYKTRLSGGSIEQRRLLRKHIQPLHNTFVFVKELDLNYHFPILESLKQNEVMGVSSQTPTVLNAQDILKAQPFFHVNGVFEVPSIKIDSKDQLPKILEFAEKAALNFNCPIYIALPVKVSETLEYLKHWQRELSIMKFRFATFEEICIEFNTTYE